MSAQRKLLLLFAMPLLLLPFALTGCSDDDDDPTCPDELPALSFVGSARCAGCHEQIHTTWAASGHPYKLTRIEGAAPTALFPAHSAYPNDPVAPPAGYDWADISYTIGGYGWKMRWIDNDGYILTENADTQYNFETQSRVTYEPDVPLGEKKYNCGRCHTTGWVLSDDDDAGNNQDGLAGLVGTFDAGGIHCEQCHGPGNRHADAPEEHNMTVNDDSALCGTCHMRNADHSVAASSGFIKHHEQYDEWLHSPHASIAGPGCNECHDPHASVKFDAQAPGDGVKVSCTDCHAGVELKHDPAVDCVDCHMPKASKSAVKLHDHAGDIKTHIWAINTDAVGKTEGMFNAEGDLVLEDENGIAAVTLDFTCYGCHRDDAGVGGSGSEQSLQDLSDYVLGVGEYAGTGGIHSPAP